MFTPPPIESLSEVDTADCEYQQGIVEIEGVVSPSSQGGWPHEGYSVHCFSFTAWRFPGQSLITDGLTLLRPVDPKTDYFDDYPESSIHRFRVLLSNDQCRAIFVGASDIAPDFSGLDEIAEELDKPVIVHTKLLGELTLNRRVDQYQGQAQWNGKAVRVVLEPESDDISECLEIAEKLWSEQNAWKARVDEYAVEQLLELKNDTWLEDNESELNPKQFKDRMNLQTISIGLEGALNFWHDDGGLFFGHAILVSGSLEGGLTDASTPG